MTSLKGLVRSLLLITGTVTVASLAYGQQPPDVVKSDAFDNTAMGNGALMSITPGAPLRVSGGRNTAAGSEALQNDTTGYQNAAFGVAALSSNTTGIDNTACGPFALGANLTGDLNTASGYEALQQNTAGSDNTAYGDSALTSNLTGNNNTASGAAALGLNVTGNNNTASGFNALLDNTAGNYNTAVGSTAMYSNETGTDNTAIGHNALGTNHGGSNNVAVGFNAGYNVRGGNYNIEIGNVGTANDVGTIRIGTSNHQSSAYIAGIANSQVAGGAVYITAAGQLGVLASSERYKSAVAPMGATTGRLKELRPVTFRLKSDPKAGRQYGLIAEEVAKVYPELVIRGDKGQVEGVRYEELTPMLLNELQQQQRRLADQQGLLAEQQAKLQEVLSQVGELRRAMQKRTP
jgi:hypothetical protein